MSPSVRGLARDVVRRGTAVAVVVCMISVGVAIQTQQSNATVVATDRIAVGTSHTCVINNDNTVWCWGSNGNGQLGVAQSVVPTRATSPVRFDALPGGRVAVKIAAGALHTCVLAQDGTVWCWGANPSGQVANSMAAVIYAPTEVALPVSALSVFAGGDNSCALLVNNRLLCWGLNTAGQLGIGTSDNNVNGVPSEVLSIPQTFAVADLAIGQGHMCAVSTTNAVWCWGGTSSGKIAVVPGVNVTSPQSLAVGSGAATRVSAGDEHTCVAVATSVSCFGDNSFGQLGYTPFGDTNVTPVPTAMGATVEDVVAGLDFTCVRLRNATPRCWGGNSLSQLGTGTSSTGSRETPEVVNGLDATVIDLAVAGSHGCALMASGEVRCWGYNQQGQLGVGDRTHRSTATVVNTVNVVPTTTTTSTTTTTTTTTTSTTSTTVPAVPPIADGIVTDTTTPAQTATVVSPPKSTITKLRLRRGRSVSASKIAKAVSMTIPKTSRGKLRISIVKGTRYCAFKNTSIRAVRKGRCTVSVTMVPKKGKKVTRKTTITVT